MLGDGLLLASILDFVPRLANRCRVLPVYTLFRASILDFRPKLGNRCKDFPVSDLLRASILDFKPRLANRCRVLPVYTILRASILDFRAKLGNRCSAIAATVRNGPPAVCRGDLSLPKQRSATDSILRCSKEDREKWGMKKEADTMSTSC